MENGCHDNPTLDVAGDSQHEMQKKKPDSNGLSGDGAVAREDASRWQVTGNKHGNDGTLGAFSRSPSHNRCLSIRLQPRSKKRRKTPTSEAGKGRMERMLGVKTSRWCKHTSQGGAFSAHLERSPDLRPEGSQSYMLPDHFMEIKWIRRSLHMSTPPCLKGSQC